MIRLYRAPFSTNCERVTLALAHKGLDGDVESVWIDYLDRSPVVADSLAILRHLEMAVPDPPLFPPGAARRVELDLFLDWFDRVWKVEPNAIEAELGEEFSAADCAAYPFLKHAAGREPGDDELFHRVCDEHQRLEGRPALAAWIERVASRDR